MKISFNARCSVQLFKSLALKNVSDFAILEIQKNGMLISPKSFNVKMHRNHSEKIRSLQHENTYI